MSRVAHCIDNGPMEGFWGIMKREMYYGHKFKAKEELLQAIEEYIPDWFRTEILQEALDKKGVLVEKVTTKESVKFALLFEFDGDVNCIRHVMYNCTSSRPSIESETKEDTIEPGTEKLTIAADPRADGLVKSKTGDSTNATTYANWYNSVYVPDIEEEAESGGGEG